jgi:hypothetical protein
VILYPANDLNDGAHVLPVATESMAQTPRPMGRKIVLIKPLDFPPHRPPIIPLIRLWSPADTKGHRKNRRRGV